MDVHTNIPLKNFLTMRIGGKTRFMADVHTPEELSETVRRAKEQKIPFYMIGGGSNIIATDSGYQGMVIRNRIQGFAVLQDDAMETRVKIGAGEIWDEVVRRTVEMGLSGIEALSGIPGTAGAAPVQNIGAYGQELSETFVELEAYDSKVDKMVTLSNADCGFSYRFSIFRGDEMGRYTIASITLRLFKAMPQPPFYAAVQTYLDQHNVNFYTAKEIRTAVLAIREEKLPDPVKRPNSGSFFKNAIIEQWQLDDLLKTYPAMPHFDMGEKLYKVPTGWLIEQTGLKGKLIHGMRVHDKNALVLINESATGYDDLAKARQEIRIAVQDKFRITIEQEPLEM